MNRIQTQVYSPESGQATLDNVQKTASTATPSVTVENVKREDVQIAISFSGERKEILVAAEAAKEQGAKVIALSAPGRSRLRGIADVTFDTIVFLL